MTTTGDALQAVDEFLAQYLGPAALSHVFDHQSDEPMRRAILRIDQEKADRLPIGFAVFSQRYEPISDTSYDYQIVSAVLPAQVNAENALEYCLTKRRETGLGYLVCRLEEI